MMLSAVVLALASSCFAQDSSKEINAQASVSPAALKTFVRTLQEPTPSKRREAIGALAKATGASLEGWERAIETLPRPWLASELGTSASQSGLAEFKLRLWCGEEKGVLETDVVLYRPRGIDTKKSKKETLHPLLISSHGTGGAARGAVSWWQRIADREKVFVLAASEQLENVGHAGSAHERLTVVALRRWALLHLPVDPARVFKTGVSRGGHITWDVVTRYPDLWAGAAPCIGGPRLDTTNGINNLRLVENLVHMKLRDLQGVGDDPGLIFNLKLAFAALKKAKAKDAKLYLQRGHGHSFDPKVVHWRKFFAARREDLPAKIVFRAVNLEQGRCHWLRFTRYDKDKVRDAYRPRAKLSVWKKLNNDGRKKWVAAHAEKRTARIVARLEGKKSERTIVVESLRGVRGLEALVSRALLPEGHTLFVKRGGKGRRKLEVRPDLELWLEELAERVDPKTAAFARCKL